MCGGEITLWKNLLLFGLALGVLAALWLFFLHAPFVVLGRLIRREFAAIPGDLLSMLRTLSKWVIAGFLVPGLIVAVHALSMKGYRDPARLRDCLVCCNFVEAAESANSFVRATARAFLGLCGCDVAASQCAAYTPEHLATQFAPVLLVENGDTPQDPAAFVSASNVRHGGEDLPSSQLADHLQHPEDRLVHPSFGREGRSPGRTTARRPRFFAHVTEDGARSYIQYWLFFPFNDGDFNIGGQHVRQRHAGDWELVQVTVLWQDRRPRIESVTVSEHWWYWTYDSAAAGSGEHPRVAVASGSHALYRPGAEVLACGFEQFPRAARTRTLQPGRDYDVTLFGEQAWFGFRGRWGQTGLSLPDLPSSDGPLTFYTDSPRGPWERQVWSRPEWFSAPGQRDDPEMGLGERAVQTAFGAAGLAPGMTHDEVAHWLVDTASCTAAGVATGGACVSAGAMAAGACVELGPGAALCGVAGWAVCRWVVGQVCHVLVEAGLDFTWTADQVRAEAKRILVDANVLVRCPDY